MLTFGPVGTDWRLDGDPDCEHLITGWFDDSENARWDAHTVGETHVEEYANFVDGNATVTGLTALKAPTAWVALRSKKVVASSEESCAAIYHPSEYDRKRSIPHRNAHPMWGAKVTPSRFPSTHPTR